MIKKISKRTYDKEFDLKKLYEFFKRNYELIFSIILLTTIGNVLYANLSNKPNKTYSSQANIWVPHINGNVDGLSVRNVINNITNRFTTDSILTSLIKQKKVLEDLYYIRNEEIKNLKIDNKSKLNFDKWSEENIQLILKYPTLLSVKYKDIDPRLVEIFIKRTYDYLHYQYTNYFIALIDSTNVLLEKELNNKYITIKNKIKENNKFKKLNGLSEKEGVNLNFPINYDTDNKPDDYIKNIIKLRRNYKDILNLEKLSNEILVAKQFINSYRNKININLINNENTDKDSSNKIKGINIYNLPKEKIKNDPYFENIGIPSKETLKLIMDYRTKELDTYIKSVYNTDYLGIQDIKVESKVNIKRLLIIGALFGTILGLFIPLSKDIISKKLD